MPERCTECGALQLEGKTCQELFDEFTTLKYLNEDYLRVHFFLVSCFMIQHRRYSQEALAQVESVLRAALEKPMTLQQLRQMAAPGMNSHTRSWRMEHAEDVPPFPEVAWRMTIIDVARNSQAGQDVEQYCALIKQWAQSTLEQLSALRR
ncbi:DUF5946 family protein [Thermosporothrix hazakensis]|nr:DUF5946 family protein [Thermosporothrix hazakensis]BBH86461.1 hypothetical protein KTC_12120 [Thermosporothrix sp. COM3]GCE50786.1 hypothetical protein KTH_56550 [Thermosporothrix hazakensis]